MSPKPKLNRRERKVKAWAVVDAVYGIVYYPTMYRSLAWKWRRENATKEGKIMRDIKVIPITITYTLPK